MFRPDGIPAVDVFEAHRRLTGGSSTGVTGADADQEGAAGRGADAVPRRAPLLLDVREAGEFVMGRAEGAELLPLSGFIAGYQDLPRDRPILIICQSGNRSGQATRFLLQQGWTDVNNVAGGTIAWARAGLPVTRGPIEAPPGGRPR